MLDILITQNVTKPSSEITAPPKSSICRKGNEKRVITPGKVSTPTAVMWIIHFHPAAPVSVETSAMCTTVLRTSALGQMVESIRLDPGGLGAY